MRTTAARLLLCGGALMHGPRVLASQEWRSNNVGEQEEWRSSRQGCRDRRDVRAANVRAAIAMWWE